MGRHKRILLSFPAAAMAVLLAAPAPAAPAQEAPGGLIAFASDRDGDAEIFVMNADGTDVRQITHNEVADHSPDWAPDGRRIVFVHETGDFNVDLHIVDTTTGEERVFTSWRNWYESDPAWSPDGRWIAFASRHPDADGGDIEAVRIDRRRGRLIATQQENSTNVDPAWSPDGARLAFVEYYEAYDLFTTSFCCGHGFKRRTLTRDGATKLHPEWSPDGTRILFSRYKAAGNHGLYTIDPNGGAETVVFEGALDARSGTWSPDGGTIAFYAAPPLGDSDIYLIDADGSGLTQLTDDPASDQHPDWTPGPR
ncbi:MAG TPA: hypothetical protein VG318_18155 [Actinomycetota bacterium]|nr:hypothetical protein [Actinomycetota bacterium]